MTDILEEELRDIGFAWMLDELYEFIGRYVDVTDEQRTAMVLYAAATHIIDLCATFPRLLFASEREESGKTLAMQVLVALCSWSINATGTGYDLKSALAAAHEEPEKPTPTVYRDEVSTIFGRDGYGGSRSNPLAEILREGYKRGATMGRSRRGVSERFNIFVPVVMTGLRTAIPRDIRSRTIVITMEPGRPRQYFDVRDAERSAHQNGEALRAAVRSLAEDIKAFRVRTLGIPGLYGRKAEVWEALFAIAYCLGGPRWLAKGVSAFRALSLSETDQPVLTERQRTLKAAAELAPTLHIGGFVPGRALGDELRRLDDPFFAGRSENGASKLVSEAMGAINTVQRPLPSGDRARGYYLEDILRAWENARPPEMDELEPEEEEDPFAVTDEEDDSPPWNEEEGTDSGKEPGAAPDVQPDTGARMTRVTAPNGARARTVNGITRARKARKPAAARSDAAGDGGSSA